MNLKSALKELDLETGASFSEVRKSYRDLIQFWHPDSFHNDAKRYERALRKTQQLNLSYEFLVSISSDPSFIFVDVHQPDLGSGIQNNGFEARNEKNEFSEKKASKQTEQAEQPVQPVRFKETISQKRFSQEKKIFVCLLFIVLIILPSLIYTTESYLPEEYLKIQAKILSTGSPRNVTVKSGKSWHTLTECLTLYEYKVNDQVFNNSGIQKGVCDRQGKAIRAYYRKTDPKESYLYSPNTIKSALFVTFEFLWLFGISGVILWTVRLIHAAIQLKLLKRQTLNRTKD